MINKEIPLICVNIKLIRFSVLNIQELIESKKLLSTYKERLEKEIIKRSNKLRIPSKICEDIINNNREIIKIRQSIEELEAKEISNSNETKNG